jgi:hypothetical protein
MMILEKAPSISFHCAGKKTTFNGWSKKYYRMIAGETP